MTGRVTTAISLFSGCGGCGLGLHQAGFNIALAADIDDDACATYAANLRHDVVWSGVDLSTIDPETLLRRAQLEQGQVDLIIGGPPCQGFSSAGTKDWNDSRNALLRHFVEVVTVLRPTWFIMENVEGLLTAKGGFYIIEAITRFLEAGYWVRAKKVYLERYGLPQRRKRVLVIGNLEQCAFDFPQPSHDEHPLQLWSELKPYLSIMDAIGDLPAVSDEGPRPYRTTPWCDYQLRMRRDDSGPVLHHELKRTNSIMRQRIHALGRGQTMRDLPEDLQHRSFTRRAFRRVMDGTPTEKRGGAPSGLKRLSADAPAPTITSTSPVEFVHPTENRLLTLRECARIQSFPDWYDFRGSWSAIATQIGNAIPPYFMEQLARHISRQATWQRLKHTHGRWLGIDATKATGMSPALTHMIEELEEKTIAYA